MSTEYTAPPQSRVEEILVATIDGTEYTGKPESRVEDLLIRLKNAIESGTGFDYAVDASLSIDSSTFVLTLQLIDENGDAIGSSQTVDLPLETMVVNGSYDDNTKSLILTLKSGSTITIPIADLVSGLQTQLDQTQMAAVNSGITATRVTELAGIDETGTNYIEMTNGVRVYISNTVPTGTIPEGSIGLGW